MDLTLTSLGRELRGAVSRASKFPTPAAERRKEARGCVAARRGHDGDDGGANPISRPWGGPSPRARICRAVPPRGRLARPPPVVIAGAGWRPGEVPLNEPHAPPRALT